MDFDLPSLPKSVVLNSSLIAAILLGAIIAVLAAWTFMPLFLEDVGDQKQQSELVVDFSYLRVVNPGMDWPINGTASNPSNETLNNIKLRVFSDGNIQGYEQIMPSLAAGEIKNFTLYPKIKTSASLGNFTVQTVVSVPDTFPAEYELDIRIEEE